MVNELRAQYPCSPHDSDSSHLVSYCYFGMFSARWVLFPPHTLLRYVPPAPVLFHFQQSLVKAKQKQFNFHKLAYLILKTTNNAVTYICITKPNM